MERDTIMVLLALDIISMPAIVVVYNDSNSSFESCQSKKGRAQDGRSVHFRVETCVCRLSTEKPLFYRPRPNVRGWQYCEKHYSGKEF
jgi:hypothetical protein